MHTHTNTRLHKYTHMHTRTQTHKYTPSHPLPQVAGLVREYNARVERMADLSDGWAGRIRRGKFEKKGKVVKPMVGGWVCLLWWGVFAGMLLPSHIYTFHACTFHVYTPPKHPPTLPPTHITLPPPFTQHTPPPPHTDDCSWPQVWQMGFGQLWAQGSQSSSC